MGIQGLSKLLADHAPNAIKEEDIKAYFGRKIAIDASMYIYQFLVAVRQEANVLTNAEGETTSHLVGLFYRTIRMLENGIKPVYVFDGKPPQLKSSELDKRQERRQEAQKNLTEAEAEGNLEDVNKYTRRLVKVTKQHNDDCKRLLKLMGVPFVEAPSEAEAQCAALVKSGKVYGTATEDMDALTFGSVVLLRHLSSSEARKIPIKEFNFNRILEEMELSYDEFIDLCILLGCDYCDSIRGVGPKRAIELIKKHKNIETILKNIDTKKYPPPEDWLFDEARKLFKNPSVADPKDLEIKWSDPDEPGLIKFLVEENAFSEDRVKSGVAKLMKCRGGVTQGRLDSFFKVIPHSSTNGKRKADDKNKNSNSAKKKKVGGGNFKKGK